MGTAVLSTLAASAASSYVAGKAPSAALAAHAAVDGYVTAFWWSAGIFAIGAIVCGLLLRAGAPQQVASAEPVLVH
jgi:hypothetical protein